MRFLELMVQVSGKWKEVLEMIFMGNEMVELAKAPTFSAEADALDSHLTSERGTLGD